MLASLLIPDINDVVFHHPLLLKAVKLEFLLFKLIYFVEIYSVQWALSDHRTVRDGDRSYS